MFQFTISDITQVLQSFIKESASEKVQCKTANNRAVKCACVVVTNRGPGCVNEFISNRLNKQNSKRYRTVSLSTLIFCCAISLTDTLHNWKHLVGYVVLKTDAPSYSIPDPRRACLAVMVTPMFGVCRQDLKIGRRNYCCLNQPTECAITNLKCAALLWLIFTTQKFRQSMFI